MSQQKSTLYSPATPLAHGQNMLLKAYLDRVYFKDAQDPTSLTSEIPEYQDLAQKTLTDIQIAYTENPFITEKEIKSLIDKRLPKELYQGYDDHYHTSLDLGAKLTKNQEKSIKNILFEVKKRMELGLFHNEEKNTLEITAKTDDDFFTLNKIAKHLRSSIMNNKLIKKPEASDLVIQHFNDEHLFLNVKAKQTQRKKQKERENTDRIISHKTIQLDNTEAIASHLITVDEDTISPLEALNKYHIYAHVLNEEHTPNKIKVLIPEWKDASDQRNNLIQQFTQATFQNIHSTVTQEKAKEIDLKIIEEIAEKTYRDIYHKDTQQIIKKHGNTLSGVITEKHSKYYFQPSLDGVGAFSIPQKEIITNGQIVTVEFTEDQEQISTITASKANINQPDGFFQLSTSEQNLRESFPDNVLENISLEVPQPSEHRQDMRDIPFITIDPASARDFDDAIYVEENKSGWTAWVAIADVSHYIPPESELYEEAFKRGSSIYLTDRVIPMLPEQLSNNLCSLRPDEDRAALVSKINIDKEGNITESCFSRALIKSRQRLEYDQVQAMIDNVDNNQEPSDLYNSHLGHMRNVYKVLNSARKQRKALELSTASQQTHEDSSGELNTKIDEHNESHGIIEELMLASNTCAINTLIEHNSPLIARVHGLPSAEKLKEHRQSLKNIGIEIPNTKLDLKDQMIDILNQAANMNDQEKENQVKGILIRSQAKAFYSDKLSGHFALQLDAYTHQTSPIRRLTDLHIHYLLNEALNLGDAYRLTATMRDNLQTVAKQASITERIADGIERSTTQRKNTEWVQENLSKTFNAVVTKKDDTYIHFKISGKEIRGRVNRNITNKSNKETKDYDVLDNIKVRATNANSITGIIQFKVA